MAQAPRALWKGTVGFGRLHVPVGLVATKSDPGGSGLRTLHADCNTPVSLRPYCPVDERVVETAEAVKAFELAKGQYVTLEENELATIELPDSRAIDLIATIDGAEFDPLWARNSYYLTPGALPIGLKPYRLLHEALAGAGCVALGRFYAWESEQLCAIRPLVGAARTLVLQTLHFADDRVAAEQIEAALVDVDVPVEAIDFARELALALRKPAAKVDERARHRGRVAALVEAKLAGAEIARPDPPPESEEPLLPPADFTNALRESLRDVRRRPSRPRAGATSRR